MYGMEKKSRNYFEFDLEKELTSNNKKKTSLIKEAQDNIAEIKAAMKKTNDKGILESFGTLVHGFTALERVLKKI